MSEVLTTNPENPVDNSRQIYQDAVEQSLEAQLAKLPQIPEKQRQLEEIGDYGYRMKLREMPNIRASSATNPEDKNSHRTKFVEYFFDFDDTVFDYTGYNKATKEKLEQTGIPAEIIDKSYDEAKVANQKTGAKMLHQELFIDTLKSQFPDKAESIDLAVSTIQPQQFINKDMAQFLRFLTATPAARVHILTYGEIKFQRSKVEAVLPELGMPMDILYAQIPKAEFLERYLKIQYPQIEKEPDNVQSFIMVDDNPEELKKLVELGKKQPFFVPVRLRKPNAKRYGVEQTGERAYEVLDQYTQRLLAVEGALWRARVIDKVTTEQWQKKGFVGMIQADVNKTITSPDQTSFDVKQTSQGTLLLTRKVRAHPGSEQFFEVKTEIQVDPASKIIYEISRNANGEIQDKTEHIYSYGDYSLGDKAS